MFRRGVFGFPVSDVDPSIVDSLLDAEDLPSYREILFGLAPRPFPFGFVPRYTVLRDDDHAPAWLDWYTQLQLELFRRDMHQATKRIGLAIKRSQDGSTISVGFRLSTISVGGFTQYRIFVRRVASNLFACRE